ncbi:response regulator [Actinacidiphila sp. ITFR-21]|uniref:response regulator n=1 Tax=Actinacidiphila sp. ITFR-21 TaxID=3075199 RepID=UPI00288981E5|nr:response regulator [Streptomyces sp. ITFR-21]WNI16818.1 response regulator [Streptomyces sp. ITFR-21]
MGELRPLADDLNDDCRQFAQALRTLFAGLEVSVRRYAARRYRDAGTVSRYLSGVRVPPWDFVVDLFADLAADHGAPATPLTLEYVRELHGCAVRATAPPEHGVEILQQQLADADREARRATVQEDLLGDALLDRQHRIADLEVRLNLLETQWSAQRTRTDLLTAELETADDLRAEHQRLKDQIRTLEADLEEARLRVLLAESRCDVLERQLTIAEGPLPALPPAGAESVALGTSVVGVAAACAAGPAVTATAVAAGGSAARILAVDDKQANLLALEAVLAGLGHEVVTADSGQAALKALLDATGFAVILLDVQMPDMDGYETAIHIKRRARTRNIPIIFLTAMDHDPAHMFRGYTAGAVDYLVKPFDPWILRAKVEAFVQMHLEARPTP